MPPDRRIKGLEGSWEWLEFAAGLPAKVIAWPNGSAGGLVASGRLLVTGGWVNNGATTAGLAQLFDGISSTALEIARVPAAASSPTLFSFPNKGLLCEIGLFVATNSTVIGGAMYIIPLWHGEFTAPGE